MTDCQNADLRDLLPEFVAGTLPAADAAVVREHVNTCAACQEDIAIVNAVRTLRYRDVSIDASAIVARISHPESSAPAPALTVVTTADAELSGAVRRIDSAPSVRRSRLFSTWRVAAAVTFIAAGGLSVAIARNGTVAVVNPVATADSVIPRVTVAVADSPTASSRVTAIESTTKSTAAVSRAALSVGELSDLSDDEIESLIKRLDAWDGAANTEPLPSVPIVRTSGGTR